ncbi:DUF6978 family protein [Limosilactobacillus vaginalis]|uniref:DUF6978 family protein n=1 Tax=Limosilactobacillus vaginalis TaxID=1633 RepID=UPI0021E0F741|nr:hypothetical protein [Limosilactobacillus vaginalis]UYD07854.1 hypothetical protein NX824_03575 [Limosilactobacillus vaginalis]
MDLNNLNENEVRVLINAEKNLTNIMEYQDIINQIHQTLILTSHTYRCSVKDNKRGIVYRFQIHSTPITTRFSVGLMFIENRIHLIRLGFEDDLRHVNNYGTKSELVILGSHTHLNSPAGKYVSKNVIPIGSIDEFKNVKKVKDALDEFISYTHITDNGR